MKVPPTFLRGACRSAMRLALQEIISGMELQNRLRVLEIVHIDPENAVVPTRKVPKNQLLDRRR